MAFVGFQLNKESIAKSLRINTGVQKLYKIRPPPFEKFSAIKVRLFSEFGITFYALLPGNHGFSLRDNDKSARDLATLWTPV